MKYLLVGDVHAKKDNLEETARLIDWVRDLSKKHQAQVVFLGDQYDDFGIMRTDILEFWIEQYQKFDSLPNQVFALVGNHDEDSQGVTTAMTAHKGKVTVIGKEPIALGADVMGLGFIRKNEEFVEKIKSLPKVKYVFCHAEFNGAQFETGFFTKHGIDLAELPPDVTFISGHIHRKMEFANIKYVGTPRWLIKSDVDTEKGVHLLDSVTDTLEFIPTPREVAIPFRQITLTPEFDLKDFKKLDIDSRTYIDIVGPEDFVKAAVKKMPDQAHFRTFPEKVKVQTEIRESEGVAIAFRKYVDKYVMDNGLSAEMVESISKKIEPFAVRLR